MSKFKTYSFNFNADIAPLGNFNGFTVIQDGMNQIEYGVRTVSWDWYCMNHATFERLPIEQNTTQQLILSMATTVSTMASLVKQPTPAGSCNANGLNLVFYNPGIRHFSGFNVVGELQLGFQQANRDPLITYYFEAHIVVEIEIL
jgi:hypothetical protein